MIQIVSPLIELPVLGSLGSVASGGWSIGVIGAPIAIVLIIGFAAFAIGSSIRRDMTD